MKRAWLLIGLVMAIGLMGCQQQRDAYKSLQAVMDNTVAADGPGVVLLVEGEGVGQQIFARGVADREKGSPVRTVSHFRMGGLTKPFISTLVLQMVSEGKLSLDDTLAERLPDTAVLFPHSAQITIRHLLNMTSGIPDYRDNPAFWEVVRAQEKRGWQPEELLPYAAELPGTAVPGETFQYSNTNYLLLQMILATVLKDPLAEELRDRIWDPVDMPDTYIEPIALTSGGHIAGYADMDGDGAVENTLPYDDARGLADLGFISSALDLGAFAPALYARTLPGADGRAQTLATIPTGNGADEYGLGIMRRPSAWGDMWGYDSTTGGYSHQMWYLPDQKLTVVVLISGEEPALANELVARALTAVLGQE
ncbi:MAG: beta-lactamase family protein [Chloroflexi bacterium]|nr:beta-lactamase family protein [Ardenticatenaceae bacterium]MBL1129372.1 class A beta-lactamase-related serine hydrolase [Chloroflexota bacterium]NOG35451.1 beta-lactamase family protein [Chloroflexota bacterium]GIK55304.1 MAG: serine-type D-Ala-D-Ala carboxypeptidase [Chloroflexota bacterium]